MRVECLECGSVNVRIRKTMEKAYICNKCGHEFSDDDIAESTKEAAREATEAARQATIVRLTHSADDLDRSAENMLQEAAIAAVRARMPSKPRAQEPQEPREPWKLRDETEPEGSEPSAGAGLLSMVVGFLASPMIVWYLSENVAYTIVIGGVAGIVTSVLGLGALVYISDIEIKRMRKEWALANEERKMPFKKAVDAWKAEHRAWEAERRAWEVERREKFDRLMSEAPSLSLVLDFEADIRASRYPILELGDVSREKQSGDVSADKHLAAYSVLKQWGETDTIQQYNAMRKEAADLRHRAENLRSNSAA